MRHALERLGWDPFFARQVPPDCSDAVARVSGELGEAVEILDGGPPRMAWLAGRALAPRTGDWVLVRRGDPPRVVRVLERRTALRRLAPSGGRDQVMAANVDAAWLVVAADTPFRAGRLARLAVVALAAGLEPGLVLNKVDLVGPRRLDRAVAALGRLLPGLRPHPTSARSGEGIEALRRATMGRTVVLLGASGVGKSSIANRLLGEERLPVGSVRARDRRGRHTTTRRSLLPIPGGGVLIDTPGLRAVGLVGREGLERAFPDVARAREGCRWRDCHHEEGDPSCGVRRALEEGSLDPLRWRLHATLDAELPPAERAVPPR